MTEELHKRFLALTAQNIFKDMLDGNGRQQVAAWGELHALCMRRSPDAELAIIDGFGPTQMDFIENGMFSKNLFIRGYAKEILDNLETTCLAHYKVRLDTYLAKSVPGKVSKIREPGKVIDIASSKKFFRSESPSI